MAGVQIDYLPHNTKDCNSKKGLKVFLQEDGSINGWCFACQTFIEHPYGAEIKEVDVPKIRKKSEDQIIEEMAEVSSYPIVDVPSRRLRANTLKEFGAHVSMSEQDGKTPTAIYWPLTKDGDLVAYHVKGLPTEGGKKFVYNLGNAKNADLINWENAKSSGAYRLIITEGPEDMASISRIYEMHGDPDYTPAVVSLPRGAGSARKVLQKHGEEIKRLFKEVVLCFDDDQAGREAVKDSMLVLPTAKNVVLPRKDANQCLIDGVAKAAYNQLAFHANAPKNTRLVFAESLHEKAREPAQYGSMSWPFPKLNEATRGITEGLTYYIGAGVKMGKSELLNEIAVHNIREHNIKVFMAKPEESNLKTYKLLANKAASSVFHDPRKDFDYEAFDKAGALLRNHVVMLDLYQHIGWETLKLDIIAAAEWGAKLFFIDPITNLTNGINAADANTMLQGFGQEISAMSKDLNIATLIFCHLKAPEGNISYDQRQSFYKSGKYIGLGNCPHEMGGSINSAQFAGSRGMMRSCNYMLGLEGNKDDTLTKEIRNVRRLRLLEDREFGESGSFDLYWDENTTRFTEI